MNIIVNKDILVNAVSNVLRAVSTKSTIPALEGILLKAQNDTLNLIGYDLELGIQTQIPANIQKEGEIVISAKIFFDMIRRISNDEISIKCDEKGLIQIRGGVTEYTILGTPATEYPELPQITESTDIEINQITLRSQIEQVLFAIATTDSKPVHTGALFDIKDNSLTLVSVDGYRLAMRKEPIETAENLSFIVPGKTLSEVSKLLNDQEKNVIIKLTKKHILFSVDNYVVVSRLLEGDFLDYNSAIPKETTTTVIVSTKEFIDSIERTSLLISDRLRSPLKIDFLENMIKLSCNTNLGKAYDEFSCEIDGSSVEMGFNNKYILDALRACDCDKVMLKINGALSPMKVVPTEGESFLFLVLPVRLKAE
ncbi:MAG: DNA polymerase III subunit beta [Oscillospiraceae bacterium]